jgi:hypothetical protein
MRQFLSREQYRAVTPAAFCPFHRPGNPHNGSALSSAAETLETEVQ